MWTYENLELDVILRHTNGARIVLRKATGEFRRLGGDEYNVEGTFEHVVRAIEIRDRLKVKRAVAPSKVQDVQMEGVGVAQVTKSVVWGGRIHGDYTSWVVTSGPGAGSEEHGRLIDALAVIASALV